MSRIGRMPIKITDGVNVDIDNATVTVKGKLGTLSRVIENKNIAVNINGDILEVVRKNEEKETKSAHGLYRALIANMVQGVSQGYEKIIVISGVGYKATLNGKNVTLNIGYSHPIVVEAPEGIAFAINTPTEISIKGIDKELVGQTAANMKFLRPVEPYHGYGVRLKNDVVIRKVGKKAGK